MPFGNHLEVTLTYQDDHSARYTNKLYYAATVGTISLANINTMCGELEAALLTTLRPCFSNVVHIQPLFAVWKAGAVQFEGQAMAGDHSGTQDEAENLPEDDAVIIKRTTGKGGRSKRGRIFMPFVPEIFQSSSALTDEAITIYRSWAKAIKIEQVLPTSGITLVAKQPDFKNDVLEDLLETWVVRDIRSRKDRRYPKYELPIKAPA